MRHGRSLRTARTIGVVVAALLIPLTACNDEGAIEPGGGQTEATPAPDPSDTDDPLDFTFGQEVAIIDGGLKPKLLAADIKSPIRFRNDTAAPQEIVFTNPGWDDAGTTTTGPIPPGGSFQIEPIGIGSISYTLAGTEVTGVIQVEDQLE
jgi:hypothetical protein